MKPTTNGRRAPAGLASGYAMPLGDGVIAYAHADGSLSFEAQDGGAFDLGPVAVAQLADLLGASSAQRAAARRRRMRAAYQQRYGEDA